MLLPRSISRLILRHVLCLLFVTVAACACHFSTRVAASATVSYYEYLPQVGICRPAVHRSSSNMARSTRRSASASSSQPSSPPQAPSPQPAASDATADPTIDPAPAPTMATPSPTTNTAVATTATATTASPQSITGAMMTAAAVAAATEKDSTDALSEFDRLRKFEFESIELTNKRPSMSIVWDVIDMVQLKPGYDEAKLTPVLKQFLDGEKDCICNLCRRNGKKPLKDCSFKCSGLSSNVGKHLRAAHGEEYAKMKLAAEEKKKPKAKIYSPVKGAKIVVPSKQAQLSMQNLPPPSKTPEKDAYERLVYVAVNDCGMAISTVEKSSFRDMQEHALKYGRQILQQGYRPMGRWRLFTLQCQDFNWFCNEVENLIKGIDQWYVTTTGQSQGFITVSHDVWDGKNKEILGLSIFFVDPRDMEYYAIPVCLLEPEDKTSVTLARTSLHGLDRYGIKQAHLLAPMNDNTNSALKAGKLIVGLSEHDAAGRCAMHDAMLAYGHSTSLKERKEGGRVTDKFEAFVAHDKWLRALANRIRSTHTLSLYKKACEEEGLKAKTFEVGNSTRVVGTWLLQKQMLAQKYSIHFFCLSSGAIDHSLVATPACWKELAEFEAVSRPLGEYAIQVQGDRIGLAGESIVRYANLRRKYELGMFTVVTFDKNKKGVPWDADTPFTKIPKVKMTVDAAKATNKIELMGPNAIVLWQRCKNEFDRYFKKLKSRQMMAMSINPPMMTAGMTNLAGLISPAFPGQVLTAMQSLIITEVLKITEKMSPTMLRTYLDYSSIPPATRIGTPAQGADSAVASTSADASNDGSDDGSDEDDSDDDDPLTALVETKRQSTAGDGGDSGDDEIDVADLLTDEFVSFCDTSNWQWQQEIKAQYARVNGYPMPKHVADQHDWAKIAGGHSLYIASKFDIVEWWKEIGRTKYKLLFLIVPQTLSLLDHNGYQERVFSVCTFFNNSLRRRMGAKKFEMAVLLTLNRAWMEEISKKKKSSDSELIDVAKGVLAHFGIGEETIEECDKDDDADDADASCTGASEEADGNGGILTVVDELLDESAANSSGDESEDE